MSSVHIIIPEENRYQPSIEIETSPVHIPPPVINTEIKQGEEIEQHEDPKKITTTFPPFPERLTIPKTIVYLDLDLVGKLKNICIKIPLL